jgi:hypothetical protein
LVGIAGTAAAQHYHNRHGGHGGHRNTWVAPAIIGGVIGYGLTRNYYEPYYAPPVVVQQPTPIYNNPTIVYDCVDTLKYSSVPGNEHIVRTCTQRIQ